MYRVTPSYTNLLKMSYWMSAGNPLNYMWFPFSLQRICWTRVPRRRRGDTRKNGLCSVQILILWMSNVQVCVFVYSATCSARVLRYLPGTKWSSTAPTYYVKLVKFHFLLKMHVDAAWWNETAESICWVKKMWNEELKIHELQCKFTLVLSFDVLYIIHEIKDINLSDWLMLQFPHQ